MTKPEQDFTELYNGLKALSKSTFPKECKTCGRLYESEEDFIHQSEAISGSTGLKESYDDDDTPIVELYRNCICGSTLMDFFTDRRDLSEKGLKRREIFGRVLAMVVKKGLTRDVGRQELLKMMKGRKSDLLEKYGIKITSK